MLLIAGFSYANDIPFPTYLPALKGVLLKNLVDRSDFEFTPGELKKCKRAVIGDQVYYFCSVEGCSTKVIDGEKNYFFTFERVEISFYPIKPGVLAEYRFLGNWSTNEKSFSLSSRVVLELRSINKLYENVRGTIYLRDYKVRTPIQASIFSK